MSDQQIRKFLFDYERSLKKSNCRELRNTVKRPASAPKITSGQKQKMFEERRKELLKRAEYEMYENYIRRDEKESEHERAVRLYNHQQEKQKKQKKKLREYFEERVQQHLDDKYNEIEERRANLLENQKMIENRIKREKEIEKYNNEQKANEKFNQYLYTLERAKLLNQIEKNTKETEYKYKQRVLKEREERNRIRKQKELEKMKYEKQQKKYQYNNRKEIFLERRKEDAEFIIERGENNMKRQQYIKQKQIQNKIKQMKRNELNHKTRLEYLKCQEEMKRIELENKLQMKAKRVEELEYMKRKKQNERMNIQKRVNYERDLIYDELHKLPIQSKIKEYINKSRNVNCYEIPITSDHHLFPTHEPYEVVSARGESKYDNDDYYYVSEEKMEESERLKRLIDDARRLEIERENIIEGLNDLNEQRRLNQIYDYKQNRIQREISDLQNKHEMELIEYE